MIKVKFYGVLADEQPAATDEGFWEVAEPGLTIEQLLAKTSVPGRNIKYITLVNNQRKEADYTLQDGDVLKLMPLLAGG